MNVLLLSWEYPPVMVGGLGRHVHALSRALAAAGHDVTVVTRHGPGAACDERHEGIRVVRVPEDPPMAPLAGGNLLAWAAMFNHALIRAALRVAAETTFDVVHAHDWLVAHSAITLREQLGIPLVTTIHATEAGRHQGWLPQESNKTIHAVECWLANESDRVVVCSHYMRWEVSHLLDVPANRIEVIPNGVEPQLWKADPGKVRAARMRYRGTGPLLGFAGRLVYEKGVQDLVAALPELRSTHPGLRLVVAGDGPYRSELRDQVSRLELRDAVSFAGFLGGDLAAMEFQEYLSTTTWPAVRARCRAVGASLSNRETIRPSAPGSPGAKVRPVRPGSTTSFSPPVAAAATGAPAAAASSAIIPNGS